jgi:hypothetical protein
MSNAPINEALNFLNAYSPSSIATLKRSLPEHSQGLLIPDMQGVSAPDVLARGKIMAEALEALQRTTMGLLKTAMARSQSASSKEALAAYVTLASSLVGVLVVPMGNVAPWLKILPIVIGGVASAVTLWANNQRRTLVGSDLTSQIKTLSAASDKARQLLTDLKVYLDPADPTDYSEQVRPLIDAGQMLLGEVNTAQIALGVFPEVEHAYA